MNGDNRDVGSRIAMARKAAGLTQEALGSAFGADGTTVSKVENGHRKLDGYELALVAEVLGTTARTLLGLSSRTAALLMAARLGSSTRTREAVRRAQELLELDGLADQLELPDKASPRRLIVAQQISTVKDSVDAALRLRIELGLGDAGISDLVGIIERKLGIDVAIEPLGDGPAGLLILCADEVALALVNGDHPTGRQHFTLAHEIGHFVLGDVEPFYLEDESHVDMAVERRADAFAIEFLMPAVGVKRFVGSSAVDEHAVIDGMLAFGVSRDAYVIRLHSLGLITLTTKQKFLGANVANMHAKVGRSSDYETSNRVLSRRAPARLERRLIAAYMSGRIGVGPIAQLMGLDPDLVRQNLISDGIEPQFADLGPVLNLV